MIIEYIISALRTMFYTIDRIIYGLIDDVYDLVIELAGTSIFSTELINSFAERIYAFVGIFMLFKVTISLITHVLNPDDFTDKEKGFTSIIKRIILSLVMIVLVPYVFAEAYEFQKLILTENTLVTLIFGTPPDTTGAVEQLAGSAYVDTAGKKMQFTLLSAFIHPNYESFTATSSNAEQDLSACRELYVKDSDGNFVFRTKKDGNNSLYHYELNPACFGDYDEQEDKYLSTYDTDKTAALYKAFESDQSLYQTYAQGVSQQDYDLTFRQELVNYEYGGKYVMDYKWIISTVVGVVTLYMLVLFCIDIAVRSIKLGFLQMIAPIPIISYIDPKSGKDGMFKKWTGMCVKTYLDLFIRLFALFFGIYIISLVGTFKSVFSGETITDGIVNVFLIIGVLIFVKKLPEILKDTFGFDGGTFKDFKFNPLKRIEEDALGGKALSRAAVTAASVPLAGAAGLLRGGPRNGLRGMTKGISSALVGGLKGEKFGKNFSNSYGSARDSVIAARNKQNQRRLDGITGFDILKNDVSDGAYSLFHNGMTRSQKIDAVSQGLKSIQDDYKQYETTAAGVDAVAKEMDKRRKAAEAAGNYAEMKKWGDAFDKRVQQIARNGGKVTSKFSGDLTTTFNANGEFDITRITIDQNDESVNTVLRNTAERMESTAKQLNRDHGGVAGYEIVATDVVADIKKVKNTAQSSQGSVDSNARNREIKTISQYSEKEKSKK